MRRAVGALALGAAACVGYGVLEGRAWQVRRAVAAVLPEGASPLRVLHISDIHLVPRQERKRDFLRGLGGLEPDLVVNTGDSISSPDAIDALLESLGRLRDVPGVFVFGSNDHVAPRFRVPTRYLLGSTGKDEPDDPARRTAMPTDRLRAALTDLGWTDVEEQRVTLTVAGQEVEVRGTEDAHENRDDYALVAGPAPDGVLSIGVTHAPYRRLLDAMTADGVDLILAGHTHGGQVCVPGHGALTTNCDLPPEHAKGLFTHEVGGHRAYVHVSAGIGMSPYAPYRFACPPEATLLTLTPRTPSGAAADPGRWPDLDV